MSSRRIATGLFATTLLSGAVVVAEEAAPQPPPPPPPPVAAAPSPIVSKWTTQLYGFVELDTIHDSTQSFNESAGNALVQKQSTQAGSHDRFMFGVRNSRVGFKIAAPEFHSIQASGLLEMDFLGNQPSDASESQIFNNPAFRVRHFALKFETPFVDVLAGQYWELFGWQSTFHPNSVEIQGLPGQVYSRTPQVRVSHAFKSESVVFEAAVAALRPPQRDSGTPDGQGGLKLSFPKWSGVRTGGATGTATDAAAIGVSGLYRKFDLPAFPGKTGDQTTNGWGVSVDAILPIIPAAANDRGNGLTLTGSFVTGQGIADQYTGLNGGISFPAPAQTPVESGKPVPSAVTYNPHIDNGLVTLDPNGNIQAIQYRSFMLGLQYYLPKGNVWLAANYAQLDSDNTKTVVAASNTGKVLSRIQFADLNVFWDITPSVRLGGEYAWFNDTYGDGSTAHNNRYQISAFYLF